MAGTLGEPFRSNPALISFTNITSGSVQTSGQIDSNGNGPSTLNNANGLAGINIAGFGVTSSAFVANGFNPSSSTSSVNLPLILGISIPVAVILIVVITIVIIKLRAKPN